MATKLMMRFGVTPNLSSVTGGMFPQSLQSGSKTINTNIIQENPPSNVPLSLPYANRTEKVINNFFKSPLLEGEAKEKNQVCKKIRDIYFFI